MTSRTVLTLIDSPPRSICILVLVAISIAWIPLIQEMNNGQLFIYIQAVSAYLSPPIAMVFCMAVAWRRMTEPGAFWGLMVGLVFGLGRMLLDFSFPSPLCMDVDERPAVVSQFHYMYFAAALFWATGIVSFVVSLATKPGEDYRVGLRLRMNNSATLNAHLCFS